VIHPNPWRSTVTNPDSAASPADPAPLPDAERDWVHARVAALGGDAAQVHAAPLSAGPDGRIVLSTDAAASAVAPRSAGERLATLAAAGVAEGAGAASVLGVHAIRVASGESLVVQCPRGGPVRVVAGTLEVAAGGHVALETHTELHVARARFADEAPIVLVGADGGPGANGGDGAEGKWGSPDGGNGGDGKPGDPGQPGPGGSFFFDHLSGTLTVVAGGGSGGSGGNGGRGGNGKDGGRTSEGGNAGSGGAGGAAGSAGDGGTIVISFRTIDPDATIQPVVRVPRPGTAGRGGGAGEPGFGLYPGKPGRPGVDGAAGAEGQPPAFKIRVAT
jgi:hypothetical protein